MSAETGPPPWWRYYEPPRWFPKWLHRLTCTHCRGMERYGRELMREWPATPETTRRRRFLAWLRSGVNDRPLVTVTGPPWLCRILVAAGAKESPDA